MRQRTLTEGATKTHATVALSDQLSVSGDGVGKARSQGDLDDMPDAGWIVWPGWALIGSGSWKWRTGAAAHGISHPSRWRHEFRETLPDLRDEDVAGSGFAITEPPYPGSAVMPRWHARQRLRSRRA